MMDKKAFEIQFNWIFVLVAGVAIILFFTAVVIKQKNLSETSAKATVLKSIEAIITGTGVSTDTTNVIGIASSNIEIGCNRISLGQISKQYSSLILFAPSLVKGDKMITQTLAFNSPYRATNFLYMTSPQIRYIIIGNNNLAKYMNKTLPVQLKKEFYETEQEIRNSNNYKIKLLIFGGMISFPEQLEKIPDSDVTAVRISGSSEKGTFELYQKSGNSWEIKGTSAYIDRASLMGAAYIDTIDMYSCNMQNAFTRLNLVTKIYINRTKELMQNQATSNKELRCNQLYFSALAILNQILESSSSFEPSNANTIADSATGLSNENFNAQTHSCALIY